MRLLIVKLSSLGDVVHAMPALQDVLAARPDTQIDWVVERAFAPLVARCEGVQRVIACDLRRWRKAPFAAQTRREWHAFRAELSAQAYDVVMDMQGLTKSALVSWLARLAPGGRRVAMAGQTEGSAYEAPTRWVAHQAVDIEAHVHAVQRGRLLCAGALGTSFSGAPRFGLTPGDKAVTVPALAKYGSTLHAFATGKPMVALVHGTSRADKEWPLAHWVEIGRRLNHSGFSVALAQGNAAERKTSEAIAAQLEDAWVWPAMELDAVVDTMARCAGVIGVDSGLSHIAVALGLPHVQIYNFDTAWRTGPDEASGRQLSVFASPAPGVDAVWQAWDSLATPVLCR